MSRGPRVTSLVLPVFFAACGLARNGLGPDEGGALDGGSDAISAGEGSSDDTGSDDASGDDAATGDVGPDVTGGDDATDAVPISKGWEKPITIDPSKVAGPLADFPVWIDLVDAQVAARAQPSGKDLFFTASDGTPLAYEIQRWDAPGQHLTAWVRVPQLSSTSATVLYLRYGDPSAATPPSPATVFSSSFAAVWHLEDALSSTTIADATGTHAGTASGLTPAQQVTAKLGGGIDYDGGNGVINFTNPLMGSGPHTISAWVSQRATTTTDALVVLGTAACGQSRWMHAYFNADTVAVGFYCNDWTNPGVPIVNVGWTLLHWVYDGGVHGSSSIYRDGALAAGPNPQKGNPVGTQGTSGYIGNASAGWGTNLGATATIDEVRIATTARSAAWIATEFANQSAPGAFYTVGAEAPAP
jgi:hypothetical protein